MVLDLYWKSQRNKAPCRKAAYWLLPVELDLSSLLLVQLRQQCSFLHHHLTIAVVQNCRPPCKLSEILVGKVNYCLLTSCYS